MGLDGNSAGTEDQQDKLCGGDDPYRKVDRDPGKDEEDQHHEDPVSGIQCQEGSRNAHNGSRGPQDAAFAAPMEEPVNQSRRKPTVER